MHPAIECVGLSKSYGGRPAVDGLDLTVAAGSVVGFLGPNGAGKTTAIRLLTTILQPDAGEFRVAGFGPDRPAEIRSRIGVLPESAGYAANQTGAEVLRLHARLHGRSRAEAARLAEDLLEQVGLGARGPSLVGGYSRGMRQRLGIARALVNSPQVVFLDEPTLGLDPAGQRDVLALIASIAREHGATVLLSTHLLAEVENACDRVVILSAGRVVADGTVEAVSHAAAAPGEGRLRVPRGRRAAAVAVLAQLPAVAWSLADAETQDEARFGLADGVAPEDGSAAILAALGAADLPVLAFELERARLADAFLSITREVAS